jgi:metal-dependent amidase/aminoacylase/carboxypeptidase family protein
MAMNKQTFKIAVQGCETHGATPHLGADTILAASAIVEALQTIISRNVDPLKSLSIVVGTVHSGTRFNIVAGNAVIEGSVFAPEDDLLSWAESEIRRIASETAKAMKCTVTAEFYEKISVKEDAQ